MFSVVFPGQGSQIVGMAKEFYDNFNYVKDYFQTADELLKNGHKVILANYQPTIEEMIIDFAKRISSKLSAEIKLHSLKLEETETSYSEWFAADN